MIVGAFAQWAQSCIADPPIYSPISETLLIIAMRLYAGVETPYSPPLIWAIYRHAFESKYEQDNVFQHTSLPQST